MTRTPFLYLLIAVLLAACESDPARPPADAGAPVLDLAFDESTVLAGPAPPMLAPIRDHQGLAFSAAAGTRLVVEGPAAEATRSAGAFTVAVELRLDARPADQAAVVSRFVTAGDDRAFELGIDRTQQPYLALSPDGTWGSGARSVTATRQVRLGEPVVLAAAFSPGRALRLYLNGHLVGELTEGVPREMHLGTAPLELGNRPGEEAYQGLTGVIGRVLVWLAAVDPALPAAMLELGAEPAGLAPARAITQGPRAHFVGYYDRRAFDPTEQLVVAQSVGFEDRPPGADDRLEIGLVDLADGDRWIPLGQSRAWCWQQGSLVEWRAGSTTEVLWNDTEGEGEAARFVTRRHDVGTGAEVTLPRPFYHAAPDGRTALGLDFARLHRSAPGYGYAGVPDPSTDATAPAGSTIYRLDLETGDATDLVSLADVARIPWPGVDLAASRHYLAHLMHSPAGTRFLFFHRLVEPGGAGRTRVLTAAADGSDVRVLSAEPYLSHYDWIDETEVLIWCGQRGGYVVFHVTEGFQRLVLGYPDGHQTLLPGGAWMLTDTYPGGSGSQSVLLHHLPTNELVVLARLVYDWSFGAGELRADAHPRLSPSGRLALVDTVATGQRQLLLLDLQPALEGP